MLKLIADAVEEPITLDEAKDHLRVDGTDEDALITAYVKVARRQAEMMSRRAFVTQTWELALAGWPQAGCLVLGNPPLQSVTWVKYTDSQGVELTLPSGDYLVDTYSEPGRVVLGHGKGWPSVTLQPGPAVRVRYVAGYGPAVAVPETYKQAIRLLVGHYYENREAVAMQVGMVQGAVLPLAVQALLMIDRGSW